MNQKTTIKNGTHIFKWLRCLVRAACTFGRNPSTRRSNCQSTSSNFWNFGLLVLVLLGGWNVKIILVGNHWKAKWREYVKIVQLLNIEFYIKLILKLLESQCQPEIHTIHSWLFLFAYLTVEAHLPWAREDYLNCSWICVIPWQQMPTDQNTTAPVQIYQSMSQKQCKCTVERGNFIIWKN